MYEELYIIDGSKRLKVDLSTPSGITLNFKSNIFGDLSKITCSYSYTFKLPLTANNRRVFDNADDIRCFSNKIRKRLRAEYIQNGIPLFSNANLYIDSTESCFNAVMTWGVIDGLQKIKDNDISIRKLPLVAKPIFGPCNSKIEEYKNTSDFVQPLYNAGLPYITETGWKNQYNTWAVFPLPAIPLYRLIQVICEYYKTGLTPLQLILGNPFTYGQENTDPDILKYGVVPCVNTDFLNPNEDVEEWKHYYGGWYRTTAWNGILNVWRGPKNEAGAQSDKYSVGYDSDGMSLYFQMHNDAATHLEVDFCNKVKLEYWTGKEWKSFGAPDAMGCTPKIHFYYLTSSGTIPVECGSLEGKFSWDNNWWWIFDCSKKNGKDRIEIDLPPNAKFFINIEAGDKILNDGVYSENSYFRMYPTNRAQDIQWSSSYEENAGSFEMDLMSNLPDISCLTLLKCAYCMIGAFPSLSADGKIVPIYYDDIRKKLTSQHYLDWSKRICSKITSLPTKTVYKVNGFGQSNYYLMKNDNVDDGAQEDETDIYASGMGCIEVANQIIDRTKTIIQLPFYGPYLKNKKWPYMQTGDTMKFWYNEDGKAKAKEAKPCFGMIKPLVQTSSGSPTGTVWMGMEIWNGFANITSNPSYAYLQRIMENPIVITENLNLTEIDLANLDYSVPVYLDKYSAYFAIVSIVRDSKGVCKCELIKLPEEESNG